jgi:beta-galactosidase
MATRREILTAATIASLSALPLSACAAEPAPPATGPRERSRLDHGWRFHLGHAQDPARDFGFGAIQATFAKATDITFDPARRDYDASTWEPVDLPHDWGVELPYIAPTAIDFLPKADPRASHGYKPLGREFPDTSVGWYRLVVNIPATDQGRRLSLEFDGVFRDCIVFVNGYILTENHSGYAPFRVDFTDVANYGAANVILLRVDASHGEGWFYEGAGVYRPVWLVKTAPVHVPQWGTLVHADIGEDLASLTITTEVANDSDTDRTCEIVSIIYDPKGHAAGQVSGQVAAPAWGGASAKHKLDMAHPILWSVEHPNLYRMETELRVDGVTVDRFETPFGLRTIKFDPQLGFLLNGVSVKLKGTCNHQDHAGVGVAIPDRLHEYRLERLKAMGSNAYRTSHNPASPALLDACDRMGMLVMDETRRMSVDPEALSELERLVRRDRNRPSVIMWSIGNEEPQEGTERGARIAATMKRLINKLDGSRPVTEAMDAAWGDGVTRVLDVVGFNYRTTQMDPFHAKYPQIPVVATETGSTVTTRGVYVRDERRQFADAYDHEAPWWASTAENWWPYVNARPYIAGGFVWTGFDYRGEPTPFPRWPSVASYFGLMDSCGFAKDEYYYYKAWWNAQPQAHLLPHWNWPGQEGKPIDVWCYANVDRVELFLNGQSLGAKDVIKDRHLAWPVNYAPGVLEARGFKGGRQVVVDKRETAGPPARIVLAADRTRLKADGADLAVVTIQILDRQGRPAPFANDAVKLDVGPVGKLIGMGNGDPTSHEPDKTDTRKAFNGLCMGIVQTRAGQTGRITIQATAEGLEPAALLLTAEG